MSAIQIVLSGLLVVTAIAGYVDYRTGHIPNRLVLVAAALGLVTHFAVHVALLRAPGQPYQELLTGAAANAVIGVLATSVVPLLLYRLRAMGGGDVKLLASVGVWAGPVLGIQIELHAFVLAALYAPARLAYRGELLRSLGSSVALLTNPFLPPSRRRPLPESTLTELRFGPAVFAGTLIVALLRWGSA
jgi:prepilin peptidase CpaA